MAASAGAAARIQAQTTRMLAQLRDLEDRYSEDEVFGDLLDLDHHVSQMGRLADSIALLSGGRSGRRWTKPIVLESVIRGAMGRIASYQRVQYHSTSTAAIAGFAAEGVMHALAELMDNAANFSPHGSAVHVYAEEEDAGIVVTVEDSGLGMRQRERERAERLVSEAADLTSLPGTRLGLAVVGRLAGKHGLRVSFRPSSRGGVGVVLGDDRRQLVQVVERRVGDGRDVRRARPVPHPLGAVGEPLDRQPRPDPRRRLPGVERPPLAGLADPDLPPELHDVRRRGGGVGHQLQEVPDGALHAQLHRPGVAGIVRPDELRQPPLDPAHRLRGDAGNVLAKITRDPAGALERQVELDPPHRKPDHLAEVGHEISFGERRARRDGPPPPRLRGSARLSRPAGRGREALGWPVWRRRRPRRRGLVSGRTRRGWGWCGGRAG
ncbi:hypothetical protein GCM10023178_67950 [Actinomadura luteofluorescens]